MFPKITLDEVVDGIWIGDTNLFRLATPRRYLMGLAAYTGQSLRFVPGLLVESELPSQFAASCLPIRRREIRSADERTNEIYDECIETARESFGDWLSEWIEKKAIEVLEITDTKARGVCSRQRSVHCYKQFSHD